MSDPVEKVSVCNVCRFVVVSFSVVSTWTLMLLLMMMLGPSYHGRLFRTLLFGEAASRRGTSTRTSTITSKEAPTPVASWTRASTSCRSVCVSTTRSSRSRVTGTPISTTSPSRDYPDEPSRGGASKKGCPWIPKSTRLALITSTGHNDDDVFGNAASVGPDWLNQIVFS